MSSVVAIRGNDCVGTSIRHGAKSVLQLEMMPKLPDERSAMNPWPRWPRVPQDRLWSAGSNCSLGTWIRGVYQTTVKEFVKDKNGNLCKVVLVKLESKKDEKHRTYDDGRGRRK